MYHTITEKINAYLTNKMTAEEIKAFQLELLTSQELKAEYELQRHIKAMLYLNDQKERQQTKAWLQEIQTQKHQKQRRIYLFLFFLFAASISFFIYQSLNSADNFKAKQKVYDSLADARSNEKQVYDSLADARSNEKQVHDSLADARSNKKQVNDSLADARSNKKQVNDSLASARSNEKQMPTNALIPKDSISQMSIKLAQQCEQEKELYAQCMKEWRECDKKMSGFINQDTLSLENIRVAKIKEELAKLSKNKEGRLKLYQKVMTIKAQSTRRLTKCKNSLAICKSL